MVRHHQRGPNRHRLLDQRVKPHPPASGVEHAPASPRNSNQKWPIVRGLDTRAYRMLNIIDEYTREALMIQVDRKLNSIDVVDALTDLFILRGPPAFIRSDNDEGDRGSGGAA